ncbi:MAG: ATP-binding protein, partial [Gemmatimonadota bacterium]|nr:ATP-binding protein [Gemmatimonadota bacterium]
PNLCLAMADPTQLEQVLLNLAINARDAMPDDGTLVIETQNVDLDEEYAQSHPGTFAGPHVMLCVSDTGSGMDAETQSRVFEPFFTTKPVGRGTGLGLSTVYGIVQQSGGSIWLYSEKGHGTTFKIYLPCIEPSASAMFKAHRPARDLGRKTILIVDDDAAIRRAAARALEGAGHTVMTATDGAEGKALADQHGRVIDLVIADLIMPDIDGWSLASHLAERWPHIPLLLMSGFTAQAMDRRTPALGHDFLQKPFTPAALLAKVHDVLAASDMSSLG